MSFALALALARSRTLSLALSLARYLSLSSVQMERRVLGRGFVRKFRSSSCLSVCGIDPGFDDDKWILFV